ncbi:Crp/Fnr family transcriptional regulator [Prolixibacteraceae bacterium Z1-6]|uniref:Crp/Fnr family transcriptional regulator n=1 Tax=Draconibacterium aestuarii TaxID=2998507 RepID=A0A9X3J4M9_9BACT|nr:Crp/Fnr family transcriptional regulator [Prolixibacteraceae bacterium Z1-6]
MPLTKTKKCQDCSCMSEPFKELSSEELIKINKNRVEVNFKKGETVIKQGALAGHIAYVKNGLVKVCRDHGSEELVLALESRGKLMGLHALFNKSVYNYSVYACEDISVCLHDINTISSLLKKNCNFNFEILKHLSDEILFSHERMESLSLKQLHGRFADILLCLSLRIYKRKSFKIPLSKKDLAGITRMSQESLSRVVKDFTKDGIIEFKGNNITILDYEKVRHLSYVG